MKNKKGIIIFLVITCIALMLRIALINTPLWYDEACSWFSAKQTFPLGILKNLFTLDLQHSPLYFFLLNIWINIFGDNEIAMRSLSLIFSIGSIYLIYRFGEKLVGKKFGIILALIMAVHPLMVIFSVEVRMYPAVVFLVLASLNFLLDFEKNNNSKSLKKMTITNILIPYTFVGGIFYNVAFTFFYTRYLKNNKDKNTFITYLKHCTIEWLALIPFFAMLTYYAGQRGMFVITHEIPLRFIQIIDILRNFFGANISANPYWPAVDQYQLTFIFTLSAIVPCIYFAYGIYKSAKGNNEFVKMIFNITMTIFILFIIFASLKIYVCTNRYILYLYPLLITLGLLGLSKSITKRHFYTFTGIYILLCLSLTVWFIPKFKLSKMYALKDVMIQAQNLNLTGEDIVILPFSADAPYYFKSLSTPRVYDGDFHKLVRNPYGKYYDSKDSKIMARKDKYKLIFEKINEDNVFSQNFFEYFASEVNKSVDSGRYLLLAMYGNDNNGIVPIDQLRKEVKDEQYVKDHILDVMFKKYICDIAAMINLDFKFIKSFKKDNYTYYLYQKI